MNFLVTITKWAEVDVNITEARKNLVSHHQYSECEVVKMSDEEVAEAYVSLAEGTELELWFERRVCAVAKFQDDT